MRDWQPLESRESCYVFFASIIGIGVLRCAMTEGACERLSESASLLLFCVFVVHSEFHQAGMCIILRTVR
jgi:hypothetical protein